MNLKKNVFFRHNAYLYFSIFSYSWRSFATIYLLLPYIVRIVFHTFIVLCAPFLLLSHISTGLYTVAQNDFINLNISILYITNGSVRKRNFCIILQILAKISRWLYGKIWFSLA